MPDGVKRLPGMKKCLPWRPPVCLVYTSVSNAGPCFVFFGLGVQDLVGTVIKKQIRLLEYLLRDSPAV